MATVLNTPSPTNRRPDQGKVIRHLISPSVGLQPSRSRSSPSALQPVSLSFPRTTRRSECTAQACVSGTVRRARAARSNVVPPVATRRCRLSRSSSTEVRQLRAFTLLADEYAAGGLGGIRRLGRANVLRQDVHGDRALDVRDRSGREPGEGDAQGEARHARDRGAGGTAMIMSPERRLGHFRAARPRQRTASGIVARKRRVRMRGLEPPRPYGHTDLNRARLPIPPHPRGAVADSRLRVVSLRPMTRDSHVARRALAARRARSARGAQPHAGARRAATRGRRALARLPPLALRAGRRRSDRRRATRVPARLARAVPDAEVGWRYRLVANGFSVDAPAARRSPLSAAPRRARRLRRRRATGRSSTRSAAADRRAARSGARRSRPRARA